MHMRVEYQCFMARDVCGRVMRVIISLFVLNYSINKVLVY